MIDYTDQITRIKLKIIEAQKVDHTLSIFGASSHKYHLNAPVKEEDVLAFESEYNVSLPACYRAFVTMLGNGGVSFRGSGAGPFYGIYPLGSGLNELVSYPERYLKNECAVYPWMSDEAWRQLLEGFDNEDMSDDEYDELEGKALGGLLPIGSQGCSYLHAIVLNGPHKGRVINAEFEMCKPKFAFENNFLDWYERWLDEVISGELTGQTIKWFGHYRKRNEKDILIEYLSSTNSENKQDCLSTLLLEFDILSPSALEEVEAYLQGETKERITLISILVKFDDVRAEPYLLELVESDFDAFCQMGSAYLKDKAQAWLPLFESNFQYVKTEDAFFFCLNALESSKDDIAELLLPFTKNENPIFRKASIDALGRQKGKLSHIEVFVKGLDDSSNIVVLASLQALVGIKDEVLLQPYKKLVERFCIDKGADGLIYFSPYNGYPQDVNYIIRHLNYRLAEFGLDSERLLKLDVSDFIATSKSRTAIKKWFEFWK